MHLIAYENDEWCRFMGRIAIGSPSLISFYCLCFVSFNFISFFLSIFCEFTCWSLEILKIKQWSCSYPKWSFKGQVAAASFINLCNWLGWTNWNRFSLGKVLVTFTSTCLLELLAAQYLRENNISILHIIYCFLFFRCLEKVFEEEIINNKDGNSQDVTIS